MTIKEFIATQPEHKSVTLGGGLPENLDLKSLSWDRKMHLVNDFNLSYRDIVVIRADGGGFFAGEGNVQLIRKGNQVYCTRNWFLTISIRDNRVSVKGTVAKREALALLSAIGIDWCRDLEDIDITYLFRPAILRDVLTGKVYSLETLWKAVAQKCFRCKGVVGWRSLRKFLTSGSDISILDILSFTVNPQASVNRYLTLRNQPRTGDLRRLIYDAVQCAATLGEKVDLSWSEKRLNAEHLRQVKEITRRKADSGLLSSEAIFDRVLDGDGIEMLNSEVDVYAEGTSMCHCLYTNYLRDIRDHRLLAFHMSYPEACTFSVEKDGENGVRLQQIHLAHNGSVSSETRERAISFIDSFRDAIGSLLRPCQDLLF